MKKKIFACVIICSFLSGCASPTINEEPILNTETPTQENSFSIEQTEDELYTLPQSNETPTKMYPDFVSFFYDKMSQCITESSANIILTPIEISPTENSKYYEFNIKISNEPIQPLVQIIDEKKSFKISLPDKIEAASKRQIINYSVFSAEPDMSTDDVTQKALDIINNFNGTDIGTPTPTNNYYFFINPGSTLADDSLIAVYKDEINPKIDKTIYIPADKATLNAELNMGMETYLTGTIINDALLYSDSRTYALEVEWNSDIFIIYYNFDHFINVFEMGKTYTFYGQIAKPWQGYSGCIRLDYAELLQ